MSDYDDALKRLAQAKLQQNPERVVNVDKPIFGVSDPNDPIHYQSEGTPDSEPIDYAKLNNPDIDDSKQEKKPAAIQKDKPMAKTSQAAGLVDKLDNEPKPLEDQYAKEKSDKFVAGLVGSLQEIPDHDINSKHATFEDMMENGELTDYEKQKLTEWAEKDANRIKAAKENYY